MEPEVPKLNSDEPKPDVDVESSSSLGWQGVIVNILVLGEIFKFTLYRASFLKSTSQKQAQGQPLGFFVRACFFSARAFEPEPRPRPNSTPVQLLFKWSYIKVFVSMRIFPRIKLLCQKNFRLPDSGFGFDFDFRSIFGFLCFLKIVFF